MLFFFKQKTAYEVRSSDWSSDVCSSDLDAVHANALFDQIFAQGTGEGGDRALGGAVIEQPLRPLIHRHAGAIDDRRPFLEVRQRRLHEIEHAEDIGREGSLQSVLVDVANVGGGMLLAEIGRAHVCTPVTNAHFVCRHLLATKTNKN